MLWEDALSGVALANIESLGCFKEKGPAPGELEGVYSYVRQAVLRLPWYYGIPIRAVSSLAGILCLATTGRPLQTLTPGSRARFIGRASGIPSFKMVSKLVRAMAYLKYFDSYPRPEAHG